MTYRTSAACLRSATVEELTRRSLIGKAAVGAAGVWAAPLVLSSTAAAQTSGSCAPGSVLWSDWQSEIDDLGSNPFTVPGTGSGSLEVSFDASGMSAGTATPGYATISPLGGETDNFICVEMDATTGGQFCQVAFSFDVEVDTLSFTLLDIDRSVGNWQDRITLQATFQGAPISGTVGNTLNPSFVQYQNISPGVDQYTGLDDADNNSDDGNVLIVYTSPLDLLIVTYTALSVGGDPQPQQIGITSFDYCAQ